MTAKEEGKTSAQIVDELLKELQSKSYSDSSPAPPTDGAEGSKNKDPPEYQEKVPSESTEPSKTSRHKRKRHHRSHSTDGECSDNDGRDRHKSRRHKHKKKKKKSSGHDSDGEHRCKSSRKRRHKDKDRGNRAGIESNAGVVWNVLHTHSSDEVEWESDTSWNTKQKLLSAYKKSESKTDASGDTDSRHVNSSPSQTVTESSVVAVDLSEKEKEIVELEDTTKLSASQTLVECDFTTEQLKPAVVPNVPEEIQITAVVTPPNINIVNPSVITLMSPADALNIESSQHSYDGTSSVLVTGPAALEVSTLELYEQKSFKVEADVPTACTAKSDTGYLLGVLVGAREDLPLAPPIKPSSTKDDTAPIEKKSEHLMFTDFWRLRHSSYVPSDGLRCGKVALETAIKNIPSQDSGVVTEQSSTMKMVLPNETIPTVAQYENKPVVEQYHSSKCEYVKETCAPGIALSDEREIRPCFVLTNIENPVNAPTLEGSGSQILTKVLSPRKSATTECMSNSCTAIDDGLFKAEVYSSQLISSAESKCSNSTLDVDCLSQHRAEVTASTAVVSVKPPNNHPLHLLKSELNENTIPAIEMPSRLSPELKQEIHSVVENPTEPSPELKKDVRSPVEASNESSVLTLSERPQEKTAVMLDDEVDKLKPRVPLVDYDDDVECVELTVEPIETIMTTVCEGIQHVPSVGDGVPGNEGKKLDIEAPTKTLVHVYEVSGIENSSEMVQVDTNAILVEDDNRQVFADNPVLVPKVSSEIITENVSTFSSEFPSQTDVAHCEINDSSTVIPLNETVIDTLPIKLGEVKKEIACTDSMEEIECVALEDAVCIESFQEGLRNSEDKLDSTKEVLQENLILSCNEKILPPDSTAEVAEPVVVNSSLLSPCRSDVQAAESDCIPQEALGSSQANAMHTDGVCGDVFISTPNEYHSSTSLGYPADAKHQAVLPTVEILSNTLNSPLQKVDQREALPSAKPNNEICEVTIAVTQEHTKHSPNAVVKSYARSFDGKPLDIQFYLPSPLQPTDACKESDGVDSLPGKLPNPFRAMMKSVEKPPNLLPSNNVDTVVQKKSVDISMLKVEHEVTSTLHDRYRNDPPLTAIDQISSHRDVQADTTANTSGSAAELSKDVMSPGETSDKTVLLNYTCDEPSPNSTYGLLPSLHVETLASSECISGVSVSDSTCILSIVASDHVTVVDTSSNGVHSCSPDKLSQENIDSETVILISESKSELCDNITPNSFSSDDLLVKLSQHSSSSVSVNPCDARLSRATANKIMSKPDASSLCDDLNSNEIGRGLNQSNIVELPNESRSVSVLSYGNELSKTVHDVSCSDSAAEMPVLDVRKVLSPSTFDKTVSDSSLQSITYTLACKHDTAKASAPAKDVPLPATCNVYPSTHSDRIMSSTYVSKLSVAKDADSSVPKSAVCVSVLPTISSTTEACTNSANDNVLSSAFSGVTSSSLCNKTGTYQSMSNTLPSEVCSLLPCKLEPDKQMDFSSEQLPLPCERGLEPKLQLTSSKMKNEIPTPVDKLAEKPLPCKIANELPIPPSTPKSPMESQLLPEIPYEILLPLDIPLPSEIPLPREPPPELLPPLPLDTPPEIPLPPELPDEIPLPPEIPVVMGCHAVMPTGTQIPVEEQATNIGCTVPNLTTNLTTCSKLGSVTCRLLTPSTDKSSSPYSVLNIPLPKLPVSEHVQQSIAVLPSLLNSKPLPIVSMFHTPRTVEHRENSPSDNDVDSQLPVGCSSSVKPLIIDDKFKTQVSNPIANDSTKSTSPDHKEMYQCYKVVSQPSGSLPVFNHSQEESLSTKTEVSSEDSSSVFVPGAAASQSSKVAWKLFPCMPSAHKSLFSLPVKKDSQGTKILGSTSLCSVPSVFGEQTELFVKERESPVRSPSPELTPEQLLIERELRERLLRSALHITSAYKGMLPPSKLAEVAALLATNKSAEAAALVTPASPAPNVNTEVGTAELNKRKDGQRVSVDVRSPLKADDTVVDADQLQSTVALPQHSRSVHVPVEDLSRMESVASKVCCKVVGTASEPVRLERQWVLMPISECFMSADLPSSSVSNQPLVEDSDTQSNLLEDVKMECCSATDAVAPPLADHTKTVSLNEHGKAETFPSKIDNQPGMVFEPRILAQTGEFDKGAIHDNKIQSTSATVSENSKVALLRLNAFAQTVTNKPTAPQPLNSIVSDSKRKKLTILMPDKLPTKQVSKVSRWGPKSSEMEVPPPVSTKAAPSTWAAMVSQQKSLLKESQASRFTSKTPLVPDVGGVQPANVPRLETVLRLHAAELRSSAASDSDLVIHSKISLQDKLRKLAQYPDFIGPEKAQTLPASGCQAASSSAKQNSRHGSGHTVSRLPGTSTAYPITDKPCFVTSGTTSSLQEKLCKLAQYSKDMSKSPPIHSQEKKSAIHIVDKSFDTKPVSEASVGATTVQEKLRLLAAYPETLPTVNTDVTNVKLNTSLQSSIGLRPVVGGDGKNEEESSAREEGELSPHSKESGVSSAEEVDEYVIRPNVKRKKNRSRHRSRRRKKKKHSSSQKKIEKSRKSSNGTSRASRSHSPLPSKKPKCSRLRKSPSPVRIDALKVHAAPVVCGESSVKISTDLLLKPHIHPDDVSCGKPGLLKSEGVNELQLHATFPDKFKHQSEVQTGNLVETLVEKTNQIGEVTKDELSQLGEDHTQISKVDVDCDDEIKQRKKEKKERDRQRKKEKKEQEKERKREKKELEKERKREKKEEKERKKEKEKQRDLSQRKDHDREHDQVKIHDRSRGHSRSKDKDGSQDRERIRRRDRSKDRSRSKDRHRSPGHDSKDHEHKKDFGASKDNEHSKGRDHSKDHDSNTTLDRSKTRDGSKECSHVRDRSKERDHRDKVDEKDSSIHSKERDQRHRSRNRESSNQRDRSRDRDRRDRSTDKDRTKVRDHSKERDRSKDRERSRDRDRRSRRWRSRSRSLSRRRSRTRSRSRSRDRWRTSPRRSRVTDLREKIDKAKLLEIARKNAIAMISQGRLPPGVKVDSLKQEQVVAIKAGGKSVAELTDFCKLLVKKEGEESSDSGGDRQGLASDDEGDGPFIQHPFKLRDSQPNIVMKIRNATQLPVKTSAEKAVDCSKLRIQFPVSSGSHHRVKESEWVPVSPPKAPTTAPAAITAPVAKPEETTVAVIAPADKVFNDPPAQPVVDIGSIVSARLRAVRKLQENPNDVEALTLVHQAQQQMQNWAESKQLPGQFTGTANARMLTPEELAGPSHLQAWVKKDQFNRAAPIDGGMGMYLLRKMGWNPGEGLGKNKEGVTEPLVLDIKMDKKGLTSSDETVRKLQSHHPVAKDLSGKHPVSALVELCSKRRWGPPEFTLIHDSGPDHKKNFLFKVKVNCVEYQPAVASPNKKHAKAQSATICLQQFGLVPKEHKQNTASK